VAASRGEQRLLTVALRLAEALVVQRRLHDTPVLLLDDILSELDREAGERLLAWLGTCGQVIYTATDAQPAAGATGTAWQLHEGRVEPLGVLARGAA
jgi:DNA replication and repair protein RecF